MALEYKSHTKFEALAPILEEYAAWFSEIAYQVAYLDDLEDNKLLVTLPNSFHRWTEAPETIEGMSPFLLNDMIKAHDDMARVGGLLLNTIKNKKKPVRHDFAELKNLYNEFLMRLRRVEKDSAYEGSGIDPDTGLRSVKILKDDLKVEMERLGRQGNPFSIIIARIDFFAGQQDQPKAIKIIVHNIKKCMRSFDDAYYLGQGEFILCLKHADKIGGKAAINRLQSYLESDQDNKLKMTLSYCLAEPNIGDEVNNLIKNMRQDLIDHMNKANIVLELMEISALERYASQL